jgi:LytS/YehU family sensor histidine kinase
VVLPVAFASSAALALASGTTGILFGVGWLAVGLVAYGVHRLLLGGVAARRRGV